MLVLLILDYLGTFAFAVSGALKAVRRRMDLFGLLVLAVVTAIGGGTLRDVMLDLPPFWLSDPLYIVLCVLAVAGVFLLYRLISHRENVLLWFDAVGLGAFTVIGVSKAMGEGVGLVGALAMGCLTGIGGGIIRDVLAGDVPVVLRREVYASASLLGALVYWLLRQGDIMEEIAMPAAVVLVTVVRLVSLHYGLGLPKLQSSHPDEEDTAEY